MSDSKIIFKEGYISQEEVFSFVESMGGHIMRFGSPSSSQGVIERNDALVWIYYNDVLDVDFFQYELYIMKKKFNMLPTITIGIGLSSTNTKSPQLAFEFCLSFMNRYRDTVADDAYTHFYNYDELAKMECREDGFWYPKNS